jgi:hypothetical protein
MAAKTPLQGFQFIVSDGSQIPDDPEVGTIIRKQATKNVAVARRKRGNYGRINLLQYRILDGITGTPKGMVGHSLSVSRESASLVSKTSSRSTSATDMTTSTGGDSFRSPYRIAGARRAL